MDMASGRILLPDQLDALMDGAAYMCAARDNCATSYCLCVTFCVSLKMEPKEVLEMRLPLPMSAVSTVIGKWKHLGATMAQPRSGRPHKITERDHQV